MAEVVPVVEAAPMEVRAAAHEAAVEAIVAVAAVAVAAVAEEAIAVVDTAVADADKNLKIATILSDCRYLKNISENNSIPPSNFVLYFL